MISMHKYSKHTQDFWPGRLISETLEKDLALNFLINMNQIHISICLLKKKLMRSRSRNAKQKLVCFRTFLTVL